MRLRSIAIPAAAIVAVSLAAAPAHADQHRDRTEHHARAEQRRSRPPASRAYAQRRRYAVPRAEAGRRGAVSRPGGWYGRRNNDRRDNRDWRGHGPRVAIVAPPFIGGYYGAYGNAYARRNSWWRVGVGLYLGVATPWQWAYPAPWYGSAISVAPQVPYGAVSLDLTPGNAAVYVDGLYVGRVDDFMEPARPLTLTAGPHQILVQAPGYAPMAFTIRVAPYQLIPYRGDLQPVRPWYDR